MSIVVTRAPAWLRIVAVVLLLWGLAGCYACLQQFRLGADAMGPASEADRALYQSLPGWYAPVYAVATVSGLLGAVALLARSRFALPLFAISFAAIAIQFGFLFATSDIVARKGAGATVPFPLLIAAITAAAAVLSRHAIRRRWIV